MQKNDEQTKGFVTMELARKRLGNKGKNMTDKQINDLLVMLRILCNTSIDSVLSKSDL